MLDERKRVITIMNKSWNYSVARIFSAYRKWIFLTFGTIDLLYLLLFIFILYLLLLNDLELSEIPLSVAG